MTDKKTYQDYVVARQRENLPYIENYNDWLAKHAKLEEMKAKNEADTWENSEHNPANYPDFEGLDDDSKQKRMIQGEEEYWRDSEALERTILDIEHLLAHPNDFIEVDFDERANDTIEYWEIKD